MNNFEQQAFFNHTTDEQFFASLSAQQRSGLDDFYHTHANTTRSEQYNKYIERDGKKIFMPQSMIGRTAHHTYIALYNNIHSRDVEDFHLETCRIDNNLQMEEYSIKTVDSDDPNRRIIHAEGNDTNHRIGLMIEMGRPALWLETFNMNNHNLLLALPIHFVKPTDFLLPYHTSRPHNC